RSQGSQYLPAGPVLDEVLVRRSARDPGEEPVRARVPEEGVDYPVVEHRRRGQEVRAVEAAGTPLEVVDPRAVARVGPPPLTLHGAQGEEVGVVARRPADQDVVTRVAVEQVVAQPADQDGVAAAAQQRVVAGPAP